MCSFLCVRNAMSFCVCGSRMTPVSSCTLTRCVQWRPSAAQPNTRSHVPWLPSVTSTVRGHWTCGTMTGPTSSPPPFTLTEETVLFWHRYASMHSIWYVCPCVPCLWMHNGMTQWLYVCHLRCVCMLDNCTGLLYITCVVGGVKWVFVWFVDSVTLRAYWNISLINTLLNVSPWQRQVSSSLVFVNCIIYFCDLLITYPWEYSTLCAIVKMSNGEQINNYTSCFLPPLAWKIESSNVVSV